MQGLVQLEKQSGHWSVAMLGEQLGVSLVQLRWCSPKHCRETRGTQRAISSFHGVTE